MIALASAVTPRFLVTVARLAALICAAGMAALMLGPFQGLEHVFGLGDKPAHAIAFFFMTTGLFLIAPRWRRGDLALLAIGAAVLSEVAQGLTGRSLSIADALADTVGVVVALAPGLIERLRWMVRSHPDVALGEISARDRRAARSARGLPARAVPRRRRSGRAAVEP